MRYSSKKRSIHILDFICVANRQTLRERDETIIELKMAAVAAEATFYSEAAAERFFNKKVASTSSITDGNRRIFMTTHRCLNGWNSRERKSRDCLTW